MAKKLTPKQVKFVEEYAKNGGNGVKAAMKAYDTDDYSTAGSIAVENLQKPAIRTITEQLYPIDKSLEVANNLHRLAVSAEDEKIQIEATKEWNNRALPKQEGGTTLNNFGQLLIQEREKYND